MIKVVVHSVTAGSGANEMYNSMMSSICSKILVNDVC